MFAPQTIQSNATVGVAPCVNPKIYPKQTQIQGQTRGSAPTIALLFLVGQTHGSAPTIALLLLIGQIRGSAPTIALLLLIGQTRGSAPYNRAFRPLGVEHHEILFYSEFIKQSLFHHSSAESISLT